MPAEYERVIAALERREPDRVPTMGMVTDYTSIGEILGKRPIPLGLLFSNRYTSRVLDRLAPIDNFAHLVRPAMDAFTHDAVEAAVKMGYDSAWIFYLPTWRYLNSREVRDVYGRMWEVDLDTRGNLKSPMYRSGLIAGPGDWDAWDKRDILRLPELYYRTFSRVQRDFGDRIFVFAAFSGGLFEIGWQSMGFERFVVAMRKEKEFVRRMIGFYTDLYCLMIEAMASAGLPGVIYSDDLAYRSGPMLNPGLYEELFGEAYRRIVETAHAQGMKIVMHSCGNVYSLLEWFADCGFDGVHALEPTAGVELARVKEMVGGRLCLLGNMDVTRILVDAAREEVDEAVRTSIRDAGAGGGYIVAPTNSHESMTVRNQRWMVEAVEKYGHYPLNL
jgi:hypothetical protein